MAQADIQNPAFTDEDKARETLEAIRWPGGPYCPHCGNADQEKITKGLGKAHRPGLYYCASCNGQFMPSNSRSDDTNEHRANRWTEPRGRGR